MLQEIIQWIQLHPSTAGIAVFALSMAESLVVVGLLVPGTAMMFAVGALVGTGVLGLWSTLAWAAAGAIMGDSLGYWLGVRYQESLHGRWPFNRHPHWLEQGEAFFHRHGGKSIFIGRFVGPMRPMIPLVAGMLGMRPAVFYPANILSGLAWANGINLKNTAIRLRKNKKPTENQHSKKHLNLRFSLCILAICFPVPLIFFHMIGQDEPSDGALRRH